MVSGLAVHQNNAEFSVVGDSKNELIMALEIRRQVTYSSIRSVSAAWIERARYHGDAVRGWVVSGECYWTE